MAALVTCGHLRVSISTSNAAPALASRLRRDLEAILLAAAAAPARTRRGASGPARLRAGAVSRCPGAGTVTGQAAGGFGGRAPHAAARAGGRVPAHRRRAATAGVAPAARCRARRTGALSEPSRLSAGARRARGGRRAPSPHGTVAGSMIDLNRIRSDPAAVAAALAKRGVQADFAELLEWDERRRGLIVEADALRARRNEVSGQIPRFKQRGEPVQALIAEMREVGQRIRRLDGERTEVERQLQEFLEQLPNTAGWRRRRRRQGEQHRAARLGRAGALRLRPARPHHPGHRSWPDRLRTRREDRRQRLLGLPAEPAPCWSSRWSTTAFRATWMPVMN